MTDSNEESLLRGSFIPKPSKDETFAITANTFDQLKKEVAKYEGRPLALVVLMLAPVDADGNIVEGTVLLAGDPSMIMNGLWNSLYDSLDKTGALDYYEEELRRHMQEHQGDA